MAGGKTIGKSLNYGFAGSYARTPDCITVTRPNTSGANIRLATALMYDTQGGVIPYDGTLTADTFVGIASRETKTILEYLDQNAGMEYPPNDAVSVFQRGSISMICTQGTPIVGGAVYVRTVADVGKNIGDFEAVADGTNSIKLANAQWGGGKDANGVCELVLLTRNNA
jgi:hypothetical protein